MAPSWHFREMARGEINVDPVHDEFFKAQDLADALVREAIQNSLDARRGHSTVRVRFRLVTGIHALDPEAAARYLRGLDGHIDPPAADAAMPFLLVEDAGTRGLTGNPHEDPELDDDTGERNDFYYFWRNVGRSGKGELDRGRWGLGKAVFTVSSRIRTMFGLTRRADDRRLLLGQAVLKTHVTDGRRFSPYGFFPDPMRPVEDDGAIDRFIDDFGVQRDEPGLSIVVPFHREDDLPFEGLLSSVIRQYFYPITRGDLVVTLEENGRSETITARTIAQHANDPSLARLCDLARWSMSIGDEEWISIAEPTPGAAPKWREDAIAAKELEILRSRFAQGDRLAFRVHVPVRRKRSRTALSHISVVIEKDDSLKRGEHHFIRRGITIPEVRSARDRPVRALLVADDEPVSTLLGDAENPAHSDWSERNDKIRNLYEQGASTLRYVKNAIAQLAALLSTPPGGLAPDLLADVFSINVVSDEEGGSGGNGKEKHEEGRVPGGSRIAIRPRDDGMRIVPVTGGFAIHGEDDGRGVRWSAEIAYRTRSGDPFRKYSALDFAVGRSGLRVTADNATLRAARDNRIEFVPAAGAFHLAVTGFDPRRDLVVRLSRKDDDDAAETQLH